MSANEQDKKAFELFSRAIDAGHLAVHETKIAGEVTCEDLGLIENRKAAPVLRAAKKALAFLADAGQEVRIYWERWTPMTREMIADLMLADVVHERAVTYFGGREDCYLSLTNKGRAMIDRIRQERVEVTRVA